MIKARNSASIHVQCGLKNISFELQVRKKFFSFFSLILAEFHDNDAAKVINKKIHETKPKYHF